MEVGQKTTRQSSHENDDHHDVFMLLSCNVIINLFIKMFFSVYKQIICHMGRYILEDPDDPRDLATSRYDLVINEATANSSVSSTTTFLPPIKYLLEFNNGEIMYGDKEMIWRFFSLKVVSVFEVFIIWKTKNLTLMGKNCVHLKRSTENMDDDQQDFR
ncbi:hypothetical protein C1645_738970 [Glomus cerebriforme]|uniref:Uncharacterized protein n=1 Tax=Glomus cerebriforme TaxID=658196 RepID=A0A397SVN2_9GLOM|nr:hypothetical protein C1645_738970 [Glomus cerebriforme]